MARTAALVWVLLAAALCGCGGSGDDVAFSDESSDAAAARVPPTEVLFWFREFKTVPVIDDGDLDLESLRGHVVLVDLFGTWRPACRKSAPFVVSLYERFHDKGFDVVGLAYERTADKSQAADAVRAFRDEMKIPYPLALGPMVIWTELREQAHVEKPQPTLILLDRQGAVRVVFHGFRPGDEAVLADRIERLLAEPASK
jgi:thiol-disulfide isomerase/thioredoxin